MASYPEVKQGNEKTEHRQTPCICKTTKVRYSLRRYARGRDNDAQSLLTSSILWAVSREKDNGVRMSTQGREVDEKERDEGYNLRAKIQRNSEKRASVPENTVAPLNDD